MNYRKLIFWLYGVGVLLFIVSVLLYNFLNINIVIDITTHINLLVCAINPIFAIINYIKNKSKENLWLIIFTGIIFLILFLLILPTIIDFFKLVF
jgi:uncharacterized membrane protein HdeD (DUF308 family)